MVQENSLAMIKIIKNFEQENKARMWHKNYNLSIH